jgi:hypothetical protein
MATSICTSNLTSGFIDLATYDELEKYMYGGADATAYFVREVRKSTWFTQVPVCLTRASGNAGFGSDWSVSISRAGDYLLYTWLRVNIPAVTVCTTPVSSSLYTACNTSIGIRWTQNLGHNLIKECCISFNDLVAARFDHYHLDFWTAFTLPEAKKVGYYNMIGNIPALNGEGLPPLNNLPAATLNVPLPFWFSRDSGVALPTAALPYNEMRINLTFRNWWELLIADAYGVPPNSPQGTPDCWGSGVFPGGNSNTPTANVNGHAVTLTTEPYIGNGSANVWANYAIVSNDERKRMACAPRDILIEQVQTSNVQTYTPATNNQPQYDIRFSHAIKALFFAVRNSTVSAEWSNYTDYSSLRGNPGVLDGAQILEPSAIANDVLVLNAGADPIEHTSLVYENTQRLAQQQSDYYSFVQPWYHAPRIPDITGYHLYSYSLDFFCLDPMGSTNYGKLTNVSLIPKATEQAKHYNSLALQNSFTSVIGTEPNCAVKQSYCFVTTVINNNIIRISGGALGFPIL